jgi:inosine-uridine nucleoside N-ribohydrolase
LLRSLWFWIAVSLIAAGVALTAALDVFYWLVAALAVTMSLIVGVFLYAAYAVGRAEPLVVPRLREVPDEERIAVIYDCDLTMGRPFRDVGDGLALLYLLGEPRIDLRAITTTYGNGPRWMTTGTTRGLLNQLGLSDIPVVPGAGGPAEDPRENQAARHLVDAVRAQPNEIVLLATGALTNLRHALALDQDFFTRLRSLYLMGGVTRKLTWNERQLRERNFSLDPEAAYAALQADCPTTITPGEAGLTAILRSTQFAALQAVDDPVSRLIVQKTRFWFALMRLWFRDDGFGIWESVAALTITHPEFFDFERAHLPITIEDLRTGQLTVDRDTAGPVRLVRGVQDYAGFVQTQFAAWQHLGQLVGTEKKGPL